ncbi:hypothetical protein LCGC14_2175050 [marine sediment metagenome]|uniref:DUF7352 domain-containing protein n=1 Tax=marine sediment metagenome TaxID=412755 RepID=A0A0F9GJS3_9ZZZZ
MRTVWKYTMRLRVDDRIGFDLPKDSKLVSVAMIPDTDHELGFWFEIETDESIGNEIRYFAVVGTGHPIEDNLVHRCTVRDREFVWHIYEEVIR